MAVRLFVSDLDGTMLPDGNVVSQENIDAVQHAVKSGIIVTIATGRMYEAALPVAHALDVDAPIISYNALADVSMRNIRCLRRQRTRFFRSAAHVIGISKGTAADTCVMLPIQRRLRSMSILRK